MSLPETSGASQQLDRQIGEQLRRLRRARGLSLVDLAGTTGLSIGFLSQIERGLSSPTLRVLVGIADALEVGIGDLFPAPPAAGPPETVQRGTQRPQLQLWRSGIRKQLLVPQGEDARLGVYLVEMEAGASSGEELYVHKGEEAGLVLEGAMLLVVEGERWTLREGDGFRFLSARPHRFTNIAAGETRVLWVNVR